MNKKLLLTGTMLLTLGITTITQNTVAFATETRVQATTKEVVAQGISGDVEASGVAKSDFAPYTLYADGTLEIGKGLVGKKKYDTLVKNPWWEYRDTIRHIIFTDTVKPAENYYSEEMDTPNMAQFFGDLNQIETIDGIGKIDVSGNDLLSLSDMFRGFHNQVTELDLSEWKVDNVELLVRMFMDASELESLNLSSWNTHEMTSMNAMFLGAASLRSLTLGEEFEFINGIEARLPNFPSDDGYTGLWHSSRTGQNYTSEELMRNYDGKTMAGTFTRVRIESAETDGQITLVPDESLVRPEITQPDDEIFEEDIINGVERSSLSLLRRPTAINFGVNTLSIASAGKTLRVPAKARNNSNYDAVSVWDGRILADDWSLSASATTFTNENNETLDGAVIEFSNVQSQSQATGNLPSDFQAVENFVLTTDTATTDLMRANPSAKLQTDLFWSPENTELVVVGSVVREGNYHSTITWTLTGSPDQ